MATPVEVFPVQASGFTQSLNGTWAFAYHKLATVDDRPAPDFQSPDFHPIDWSPILVPGNWELQGFAEPRYARPSFQRELVPGVGLYRRSFRVPDSWTKARRVILRFEGVQNGFEVWVNGHAVGASSASAYNPHSFDITDALGADPGTDQLLAVRVATQPLGWEFDINDDWALSGIFRDVTLFSVPTLHARDIAVATRLKPDGSAALDVTVQTNLSGATLQAALLDPSGTRVAEGTLAPQADLGVQSLTLDVAAPQLWTAESPYRYRLRLSLNDRSGVGAYPQQVVERSIGLREISIVDGVLLLNGRPIKLRGVDHHDLEPATGRAVTAAGLRADLELMQRGNINFVRTSHYPPHPHLLDLCDELGIYVMCEVPIGRGQEHHDDPAYRQTLLNRVTATINRDKLHPSIILWSIGNENHVSQTVDHDAAALAKRLDSTRPICIPKVGTYFAEHHNEIPSLVDVFAPHYPTLHDLAIYARTLERPTIFTEYAHAQGLRMDRFQDQWETIQSTPRFAGGAIWHFMDQGILRTAREAVDREAWTEHVWLDPRHYLDTFGEYGSDGITYADRTPKPAYWLARKAYSPVQIPVNDTHVRPGPQTLSLSVENRYDFRSLAGLTLAWRLLRNSDVLASGQRALHAPARARENLAIPVDLPPDAAHDVLALELRCLHEDGTSLYERVVSLDLPSTDRSTWVHAASPFRSPLVAELSDHIEITFASGTARLDRHRGTLSLRDHDGQVLVADIRPHAGRETSRFERWLVRDFKIWNTALLEDALDPEVTVTQHADRATLRVAARHSRPKNPQQALDGYYEATFAADGTVRLRYDYTLANGVGHLPEAGLSLVLPRNSTEFRWIGQGPWSGYPGMDRHNEFGRFHLTRNDIRFEGNRRGVELALLTRPDGAGIALVATSADVAVDRRIDSILLRHNALLSGVGNKNWPPETFVSAADSPRIAGEFTLVLLDSVWPSALSRWFGSPSESAELQRPFYHSYDQ